MKIILFGASGATGLQVLEEGLPRGHKFTALARTAQKLDDYKNKIQIVAGDVLDQEKTDSIIAGADAIISVLGSDNFKAPGNTLSQGMKNIVASMKKNNVQRVIALAGSGVLQQDEKTLRQDSPNFPSAFAAITKEHLGTYNALKDSGLQWTLVCTPDLTLQPKTTHYRVLENYLPEGGHDISRADVAHFMIDEIEDPRFLAKRVGLAY